MRIKIGQQIQEQIRFTQDDGSGVTPASETVQVRKNGAYDALAISISATSVTGIRIVGYTPTVAASFAAGDRVTFEGSADIVNSFGVTVSVPFKGLDHVLDAHTIDDAISEVNEMKGTDNLVKISTDVQDLSATLTVNGEGASGLTKQDVADALCLAPQQGVDAGSLFDTLDTLDTDMAKEATLLDVKSQTDNIPASPAAVSDIPTASDIVTAIGARIVDGTKTGADLDAIVLASIVGKEVEDGGDVTAYKQDGTTPAFANTHTDTERNPA